MSDTILTLQQVGSLFQSLTSQVLQTSDPSVVRVGWAEDGQPARGINDDVVYLLIAYQDANMTRQFERSYDPLDADNATESLSYTSTLRVAWNVCGPNSFDNADLIRSSLVQSTFKSQLQENNLGLVMDIAMPTRAPELRNGQWWEQTAFHAFFNQLVVRRSTIPYLATSDVQVKEG